MVRVGVLTLSDRCARGEAEDRSGARICALLPGDAFTVVHAAILPDEEQTIRGTLRQWAGECDVILTTGGTGLAPRDVTPEATRSVLDRECPGIAEAIRAFGYRKTPNAILSRGVAGMIGACLVVNLPGSTKAVEDGMEVLLPVLGHAVDVMRTGGRHE